MRPDRCGNKNRRVRARRLDLLALEGGNELRDGVGEEEPALLVEHHHGDTRDRLGHRGDPEERVGAHRRAALHVLEAGGMHVDHLALPSDEGDDTAGLVAIDEGLHSVVEALEPRGRDADALRRRRDGRRGRPSRGRRGRSLCGRRQAERNDENERAKPACHTNLLPVVARHHSLAPEARDASWTAPLLGPRAPPPESEPPTS